MVSQDTMKCNNWALATYNDDVALLTLDINFNKRRRNSQPNCTEDNLDEGTYANNEIGCPWNQVVPYPSSGDCDFESQKHSHCFGQHSGNSHSEYHSKGDLLQDAHSCVWIANKKKGTKKTKNEWDEQGVAEIPVIGLHKWCVMVLHEDPKNHRCECREAQCYQGQSHPQGVFIAQKAHSFVNAMDLFCIGILVLWTLYTLIHIWWRKRVWLVQLENFLDWKF